MSHAFDGIRFINRERPLQLVQAEEPKKRHTSAFQAANVGRLSSNWKVLFTSVDQDVFLNLRTLRGRSRDLAYNNNYIKRYLELSKTHVIGPHGIKLQNRAKKANGQLDTKANQLIEDSWQEWGKRGNCDVTGKLSWVDLQKIILESVIRDGDLLIRKVRNYPNKWGFALQLIEADQLWELNNGLSKTLKGNKIRMGVELDAWDKPVAYHILKDHPGDYIYSGYAANGKFEIIPAADIIHPFITFRPRQTRGLPWMHACMYGLNLLSGYEEAEVVAARTSASKMGFLERGEDGQGYEGPTDDDGNVVMEAEPGAIEQLPAGVTFKEWNPLHPNGNFAAFQKAILRGVASGLNTSFNTMANDLEHVNFSSMRAGTLEDRDNYKTLQNWFIENVPDQIFPDWLRMGFLKGAIPLNFQNFDKYCQPYWQGRRWNWVDPLKDWQATKIELGLGTKSLESVIRELGGDPDEVLSDVSKTKEKLTSLGLEDIWNFIYSSQVDIKDVGKLDEGSEKPDISA